MNDAVARGDVGLGDVDRVAGRVGEGDVAALDVDRELGALDVAPEQVAVSGREVYSWHPGGSQGSPLAKRLAKTGVSGAGTNRNWRTVTKLLELADESSA